MVCGLKLLAIHTKNISINFHGGPQNNYLAHTITCLPSWSNCIRRTLYLAVLGQVDEDESRKKTRLKERGGGKGKEGRDEGKEIIRGEEGMEIGEKSERRREWR